MYQLRNGMIAGRGALDAAAAGGGGGEDADTTAWASAVVGGGGSVGATQRGYVDTLIKAYKAAGVWAKLDREWLYASENIQQAAVSIVNPGSAIHSSVAAPTFTANRGYTCSGGAYIDTNYTPGTTFTLNSLSYGAYVRSASSGVAMGVFPVYSYFKPAGGNLEYDANEVGFFTVSNPTAAGSYIITRTASNALAAYKNNSSTALNTQTNTPSSVPVIDYYIGAANLGGSPTDAFNGEIAAVFFGGGLTGAEAAAKNTALNAYMTSVGASVY